MWQKSSLNFKLRFSFGIIAFILFIVGSLNIFFLNKTVDTFHHVSEINLGNAITLGAMDSASNIIQRSLLQMGMSNDEKTIAEMEERIKFFYQEFDKHQKHYEGIPFVEGEAALYDELKASWDELKAELLKLQVLAKDPSDEAIKNFSAGFNLGIKDKRERFYKAIEKIITFQNNEAKTWAARADSNAVQSNRITIVSVFLGVLLAIILAFVISSNLSKVLRALSLDLAEGSQALAETSTEIAHSSESLSSSVHEQAAAIQETSASAEELTQMVNKAEENAQKSTVVSKESSQSAEEGKKAVEEVIKAIERIHEGNEQIVESVGRNNRNIEEINRVILEIAEKTKVINEIVFQTKLLSFNASVEAARAGEQGKGFAVVAEEVGNLATMSGNAAQDISNMLNESTAKVQEIVRQTKEEMSRLTTQSKNDVENGIKVAKDCDVVLNEIVKNVNHVDQLVREITEASKESSKGIQEITRAMSQLDQTTQMNSAAANEAAVASKNLSQQALSLNSISQTLKFTIEGQVAS